MLMKNLEEDLCWAPISSCDDISAQAQSLILFVLNLDPLVFVPTNYLTIPGELEKTQKVCVRPPRGAKPHWVEHFLHL